MPASRADAVDHLKKYPVETLDKPTLGHLRNQAEMWLEDTLDIVEEDKSGEFLKMVMTDIDQATRALIKINRELRNRTALMLEELHHCKDKCRRYDRELNEMGIPPNGDDYNALMDMLENGDYRDPHRTGR